jgi:hypothetical protein
MTQYELVREPRGEVLDRLIAEAVGVCDRFTFERSEMVLHDRAELVLERLKPFLIGCEKKSETPGSIMLPEDAITLCTYRLDADSATVIRESARRLYDWVEPDLPQDLSFLRQSEPWLINLAADRASFLVSSPSEAQRLQAAIPGLQLRQSAPEEEWSIVSRELRAGLDSGELP